ncbi:hydrolase [Cystoisospora suis]|uniref:Hydrolase n=1 Tax=Cystoisospora suis TaxID=483139 RepID=A0A2C6L193_9APIC|nr:hydrolase [Cystoisospora suis]
MGLGSSSLGDAILFPAPPASYGTDLPGLVWIEENFKAPPSSSSLSRQPSTGPSSTPPLQYSSSREETLHRNARRAQRLFPAFFIEAPGGESKCTLLYWHGNSCDLGQIYEELDILSKYLNCHILAIEFPGYGLAPALNSPLPEEAGSEENSSSRRNNTREKKQTMGETINQWSRAAFNFLLSLGVPPSSIICFGRSIGTGPASYLAASLAEENIHVGGVVLHAPYITVHKIVQEYASVGTWLISNHWSNAANLEKMGLGSCPLLIIHGEDDEVIPTAHGRQLYEGYRGDKKEGFFPADSSHNSYYIIDDLGKPMETFIAEKSRVTSCSPYHVTIPAYMRDPPLLQLQLAPAATQTPPHSISTPTSLNQGLTPSNVGTVPSPLHGTISPPSSPPQDDNLRWRPLPGGRNADKSKTGGGGGGEGEAGSVSTIASSAMNRSSSALGHLIADVTGSKGGEWDVGVSHTTKDTAEAAKRIKSQTGADSVSQSIGGQPQGEEGGGGGTTPAGSPPTSGSCINSHEAGRNSLSPLAHQRSGFSRMIESGIFSHGSLAEIMDEALREINAESSGENKTKSNL